MPHISKQRRMLVLIGLLVLAGAYYGIRALTAGANGGLQASGSIEAVIISISPEMAGKVSEVPVKEGQPVKAGDLLLILDHALLESQREVASAALVAARAAERTAQSALEAATTQYWIALETALTQDRQARLSDWFEQDPKQFDQPGWYFTRSEQIEAAQEQVDASLLALDEAHSELEDVDTSLDKAEFLAAERRLLDARLAYLVARDVNDKAQNSSSSNTPVGVYNRTHCGTNQGYRLAENRLTNVIYTCKGDPQLSESGQALYDSAGDELEAAQAAYNELLSSQAAADVLSARAEVAVAQERYYSALEFLHELQTADQSPVVSAARSHMEQAQAAADQAHASVSQAQANMDLLQTQLAKLKLYAPIDGVILTRAVEPGEFVQPGAVAMTMANLNQLTITVYVPEDRYGAISIGQLAEVSVDSFPDTVFHAQVIRIADQAEFTPRNVQTVEGRSGTLYAVTLSVPDTQGKLKIGMPADVRFLE